METKCNIFEAVYFRKYSILQPLVGQLIEYLPTQQRLYIFVSIMDNFIT